MLRKQNFMRLIKMDRINTVLKVKQPSLGNFITYGNTALSKYITDRIFKL